MLWQSVDLDFVLGVPRNQCSPFTLLPMKTVIPQENEDESSRRLCDYLGAIFQKRAEDPRHHQYENFLRYVQKAPDDIRWVIDKNEFDELLSLKKESAPGPDVNPYSFYRCAGGLGSQILFCAYKHVLVGGTTPAHFAESGAVFISKSSDIDDNVDRCTSHVTFSPAQCTCFMMCDAPYWLKCLHERVGSSPWSSMSCV